MADWEHFHHEADIGLRGRGKELSEAFAGAATALMAAIADLDTIRPQQAVTIECDAPDNELLLVDWLNHLIFEVAARKMLFARFDLSINHHHLVATAWGEPLERERHHPAVEAKGATYTELRVCRDEHDRWLAQCVVDL